MGSPWRLREGFATSSRALHEDVAGAEGFEKASRRLQPYPRRLHGAFAKASRRRHGRLHLETIRQIMTSLHERFMKTSRALKASRRLQPYPRRLHGAFLKASRRRHWRLHLETIRQIMTSPPKLRHLLATLQTSLGRENWCCGQKARCRVL